ncbi:MAG: hypothetical protein AAGA90_07855 [Actinomycetota bacterium]
MIRPDQLTPGTRIVVAIRPDGLPTPCVCCLTRLQADPTVAFRTGVVEYLRPDELGFRVDHDGRTTYAALVLTAGTHVIAVDHHHAVCAACGELLPCRHQRADAAAAEFRRQIAQSETARRAANENLR